MSLALGIVLILLAFFAGVMVGMDGLKATLSKSGYVVHYFPARKSWKVYRVNGADFKEVE